MKMEASSIGPWIACDFEYRNSQEPRLELVCVALSDGATTKSLWLHKDKEAQERLKNYLLGIRDTHTLLVWNYDAEGRSFISLGLNPAKFKCIDLNAEWKHLTNHNDKLGYGKHFIDGKFKKTSRRAYGNKWDTRPHDKTPVNLLGCTYKLLGKGSEEEYKHKNKMRDLILGTEEFSDEQKKQILEYCKGDIADLYDLYKAIMKSYRMLLKTTPPSLHQEMLWRGETVARQAIMASTGYPVNRAKVTTFAKNVRHILNELQSDINRQFPGKEPFRWDNRHNRFALNTKLVKDWVREESGNVEKWVKTDKGDISISLPAFEKFYSWRHDFPEGNFAAQFLRYLKTNQNLNGFRPKSVTAKNQQTFFDYYGSDDRAHPYLNSYGAQSARYQPKATGFLHLKAAWMRSLVEPKPGRAIVGIDYSSEEFLLSALLSEDKNMIDSYASGDVYLDFGKKAGAIPQHGTKKQYKEQRDLFKATVLGISYGMQAPSLAAKLTADTGVERTEKEAEELINMFYKVYKKYYQFIHDITEDYEQKGYLRLSCGWYLWGDNDNIRSVRNFPVQGMGSSILRKAIQLIQDEGIDVILPLHDATYQEIPVENWEESVSVALRCMREAFAFYFKGEMKRKAHELIRLDVDVWGPDIEEGRTEIDHTPVKMQKLYIDERSYKEYQRFSQYFEEIDERTMGGY